MFLLTCTNREGNIKIKSYELSKLLDAKEKNTPAIFEDGIVLNWNMYAGVVEDRAGYNEMIELRKLNISAEEAQARIEGGVSPFAKLLEEKRLELSHQIGAKTLTRKTRML